ncbi:sensor histidine kinase [Microlunatus parietis]|uniref:histidine kinase n=1 Tax=Microlunatus parietis TaxID=682979 RepID=A0A7Y9I6W2_9ACTN|nr:histidine kinase [Microlunatus parietis]NYE71377.1 signal transduction histidine kinase [Microlunatus parietis]
MATPDLTADEVVRRPPPARFAALALGLLAGLLVIIAVACCVRLGWSIADALDAFVLTNAVMGLGFAGCGAVLAWHRTANPIGWLFVAGGLLQTLSAALAPAAAVAAVTGAPVELQRLMITGFGYSWTWAIGLCIPVALLIFPDGRPLSSRWRWVIIGVVITAPLFAVELGADPTPSQNGLVGYLTLPAHAELGPLWLITEVRTLIAYLLGLVSLMLRFRRGTEVARRQLLWLLLAVIIVVGALLPWSFVAGTPIFVLFSIPLIPIAVTVAVVRHQLLDIRLVVSRVLAWALLSLAVVVAYTGLVFLLDRVISEQLGRSAVATVLLVLAAAPVLHRLQRLVDRVMYGDRADPARVWSRFGAQLATDRAGLSGIAESIGRALRLPYLALEQDDTTLAGFGPAPDRPVHLPLIYDGAQVGRLAIGLRPGERRLADADRRVLDLLAAPLAVAVHATVVSAELQASRERLVEAREEERRRLRRELHDGLGPSLTGIAFTADAAANQAAGRPELTGQTELTGLLDALRRDARVALADVRRVVDDLRPPALDELGLTGAIRQRAEQLGRRADGDPIRVTLDLPDRLPPLPAAVEVAAYRIVTEALTNAVRHSCADHVLVRLGCTGRRLEVSVADDGTSGAPWQSGVGLQAMKERAAEVGGGYVAGPSSSGGRVDAWLPLGT